MADRHRTNPPRPGVPLDEIDEDFTPPPVDLEHLHKYGLTELHQVAATAGGAWVKSSRVERLLIELAGQSGRNGVIGSMRELVKQHQDRLDELCDEIAAAEDRAAAAAIAKVLEIEERLAGRIHGLEERMNGMEKQRSQEAPGKAVAGFKMKIVWGALGFVALIVAQVLINRVVAVAAPPPAPPAASSSASP